ncbi:membrane-associated kinase regulator 5-like [Lycium barbarum]|uniref:membrane-associated kinase regulator 5-like n=1 Tax=Lycium barbarum TaxID=112863 RepID=UPI00293EA567|nr:membrane-associated kinase regulator 5-like [Lycium barbarum]
MKTSKLLKCWPNADPNTVTVADTVPYSDSIKNLIYGIDCATNTNEETHYDEDSFFDLVLTGPDGNPKEDYNSKYVKQGKSECDFTIDSHSKPHSPVTVLGSGTKLRVFFLGFRKSNQEKSGIDDSFTVNPKHQNKRHLPRGNSLRSKDKEFSVDNSSSKQFARAAEVPKFLKLVKPLYARNSKMCTDKIKISDQVSTPLPSPFVQSFSSSKKLLEEKQGNRVAGFGAVCKHVMKSRSTASSSLPMNRRDDSLLEQNDGIQGAILHCKRSYSTASKDFSRLLPRSTSEDVPRGTYYEEESRWSI